MAVATVTLSSEPRTRRWTREEYYRLAADGFFIGQRVQLVEGEIIQMAPQGHPHAKCITLINRWLNRICDDSFTIRCQMPLNALADSDPEPDIAVLSGPVDDLQDHPQTALLAIEVSDSSLRLDRRKASLYAAANVREYWIVNIDGKTIEIHRDPQADGAAEFGFAYAVTVEMPLSASIAPLMLPNAKVRVADLLP